MMPPMNTQIPLVNGDTVADASVRVERRALPSLWDATEVIEAYRIASTADHLVQKGSETARALYWQAGMQLAHVARNQVTHFYPAARAKIVTDAIAYLCAADCLKLAHIVEDLIR